MLGRIYLVILFFIIGFFACNPPDEDFVYDYSLTDINIQSDTYGKNIGPGYFENHITLHYFGHQY